MEGGVDTTFQLGCNDLSCIGSGGDRKRMAKVLLSLIEHRVLWAAEKILEL